MITIHPSIRTEFHPQIAKQIPPSCSSLQNEHPLRRSSRTQSIHNAHPYSSSIIIHPLPPSLSPGAGELSGGEAMAARTHAGSPPPLSLLSIARGRNPIRSLVFILRPPAQIGCHKLLPGSAQFTDLVLVASSRALSLSLANSRSNTLLKIISLPTVLSSARTSHFFRACVCSVESLAMASFGLRVQAGA
jgi:hypothetical protein